MSHTEPPFDRSPLLDELRADSAIDTETLDRVRERVAATLTAEHLAALGQRARHDTISVVPQPALPTRLLRASWIGLAAALAVGTALGAGGHAVVSAFAVEARARPPSPRLATAAPKRAVPRPAPALEIAPTAALSPPETALSAAPREARLVPSPAVAPAPSSVRLGLDSELQQLEQARSTLSRGQPSQALALLASHAQRFPRSMLAQERDALIIKSLVAAGRHSEARATGERFIASYPNGLLLDAVQASLAAIP